MDVVQEGEEEEEVEVEEQEEGMEQEGKEQEGEEEEGQEEEERGDGDEERLLAAFDGAGAGGGADSGWLPLVSNVSGSWWLDGV